MYLKNNNNRNIKQKLTILINDTALMKKIRQQTSKDLELNYYQNNK